MKNKMIARYTMPYVIGGVLFFGIAVTSWFIMSDSIKQTRENAAKGVYYPRAQTNYFLSCILIVVCTAMSWFGLVSVPNNARKNAAILARKYMSKHKELRDFSAVLNDEHALLNIAAVIANSLTKKEQNEIFDILKNFDSVNTDDQNIENNNIDKTEQAIITVIKKHEITDRLFMGNIRALARKSNAEILKRSGYQR